MTTDDDGPDPDTDGTDGRAQVECGMRAGVRTGKRARARAWCVSATDGARRARESLVRVVVMMCDGWVDDG